MRVPQQIKDKIISKVSNELSRGISMVEHSKDQQKALHYKRATGSYYLIIDGHEVLTYREWYQLGSPAYLISGSYYECNKEKDKLKPQE